jgi:hypothetical protein
MTPILGILLIFLITFAGVRIFARSAVLKKPLLSGLIVSGVPYILTGVALGPQFFNFLSKEIIDSLEPIISLAIGWVGLIFGIQLRWRNIKRFPGNYLLFTSLQSMTSFLFILLTMGGIIYYFNPSLITNRLEAFIILAAIGSMTAPLSIARLSTEKKIKGRLSHLIQFISSLDSFWGITIAGLVMAIYHPPALRWFQMGWQWILLSLGISIFLGMLFHFILRFRFDQEEIFLLVLGFVVFTSGIGFYLKLSPIFMTMMVGITIAQFPREAEKVMRVIHIGEKPTYLLLLVFAGAMWNYRFWEEILFIAAFVVSRFFGKYWGGWISAKNINCGFDIPKDVGKALLSFGGISLAIAFNFQLFYGGLFGDYLMSATILGLLIFDEYTAVSIRQILKKRGEVR